MKLFSIFSRPKPWADNSSSSLTSASVSSSTGEKSNGKSRKTEKCDPMKKGIKKEVKTKNYKCIKSLLKCLNTFEPENPQAFIDCFVSHYKSKDSKIVLEDGDTFDAVTTAKLLVLCHQSFPDFQISYETMKEDGNNQVIVDGIQACGTHTGAPFTIMPGVLPELAPSGKKMSNDEERYVFKMKDGKIVKATVIAMGNDSGFEGMYSSLGGSLAPPSVAVKKEESTESSTE